jgi:hypothetical protein
VSRGREGREEQDSRNLSSYLPAISAHISLQSQLTSPCNLSSHLPAISAHISLRSIHMHITTPSAAPHRIDSIGSISETACATSTIGSQPLQASHQQHKRNAHGAQNALRAIRVQAGTQKQKSKASSTNNTSSISYLKCEATAHTTVQRE